MKKIPKEGSKITTKKEEVLLVDLLWIKTSIFAHDQYWLLIMDEYANLLGSYVT
jgi:hypothetical protein